MQIVSIAEIVLNVGLKKNYWDYVFDIDVSRDPGDPGSLDVSISDIGDINIILRRYKTLLLYNNKICF